MNNYCTLFDKNYLVFGLALHRSLIKQSNQFKLFILAMDDECDSMLRSLKLENVEVISLSDVVTSDYSFIYEKMSFGQVCWTSQPLLCKHILNHYKVDSIVYLEADSYFFDDPGKLIDELEGYTASLVPHRYSGELEQSNTSGIYCVQFNYFKNNESALELLKDWELNCLKYDKYKRRYLPGQLCLDIWPQKFIGVKVIDNITAGVAPWNLASYEVSRQNGMPFVDNKQINFFHFHELSFYETDQIYLTSYNIQQSARDFIYAPYLDELKDIRKMLGTLYPDFHHYKHLKLPRLFDSLIPLKFEKVRLYLRYLYLRLSGRLKKNCVKLYE